MRGTDAASGALFSYLDLDERCPCQWPAAPDPPDRQCRTCRARCRVRSALREGRPPLKLHSVERHHPVPVGRSGEGRLLQPPANHHQPGPVPEQDLHLLCHVDGMGTTDAARLFGIDQKTVATILKHSAAAGYRRIRPPVSPKPDRFIPFIDEILEDDGGELKK